MATLLLGERIAKNILDDLKAQVAGKKLQLAVVQVGSNPVSEKYIKEKKKAAKFLGVRFRLVKISSATSQEKMETIVENLGRDKSISGMIVQLPLPKSVRMQDILNRIPLRKDVDVLSSAAFGLFALGQFPVVPPTVWAVSSLLEEYGISTKGKRVVIVGAGRLVGMPLTLWFLQQGATVSVATKSTKNLGALTRSADILISATGQQNLIKGVMVKRGAVVIDAGTSVESGKTKGDVDFRSVSKKAGFITPVPGGVGPLTVACLFQNLCKLS
ncbi:MAG: bifunctional 5,10-methylenetetrahydrofolate dehydrogenase/5,10-methenyltetrahydrofolate cyclohydrolase [Candidatus Wildermuthbacteria bacterium]|nr:bifunctional 5,10-methylenetetrahydrofolate dehydrogenase/5,10-methenyltetrahydrofolate cyclohydrolase [Candidatus Wildermuthbacteria bacterium]